MTFSLDKLKLCVCLAFALFFGIMHWVIPGAVSGQSGQGLAAPTGATATTNLYNNKIGIHWDAVRGATTYRILRGSTDDVSGAVEIGSTAANSFFDTNAAAGQTFFYWVRATSVDSTSDVSNRVSGRRTGTQQQGPVSPLEPPPAPAGNPVTAAKAYLGKALFWDEQMSSTRTVSCGTCHHSGSGGTDPRSVAGADSAIHPGPDSIIGSGDDIRGSAGVPSNASDGRYDLNPTFGLADQVTPRKTISYLNAAYSPTLFWDGRATPLFRDPLTNTVLINNGGALENQAIGPPLSSVEMAHAGRTSVEVAERVALSKPLALSPSVPGSLERWIAGRSYPELFREAFGSAEVTPARIAMAIATFERTLFTDQTPLDLANAGIAPLTAQEQRGRNTFNLSGCATCHGGPLLTDNAFHNIGVRPVNEDTGRFQVTGNPQNLGEFRTPGLRNVELRQSFFHNGRFTTLEEVVEFYNRGGDFDAPNLANVINPLGLNDQQKADLVAFLKRPLTDPRVAAEAPPFDRPALYMESDRVPQITGTGRSGSGGFVPQIKAISPPLAGNPNFTISVSAARGSAPAVLVIDAVDPGVGNSIPSTGLLSRLTVNTQNAGWASLSIQLPSTTSVVGRTFFARWYVDDPGAANGFSVSQAARFTIFGEATTGKARFADFDGDGRTDISVFRQSEGNWYILRSSDRSFSAQNFGLASDTLAPADYDGDGRADLAVFRNGTWYISRSRDGFSAIQFGVGGDIPQPGDYDGDGRDDIAVYRPTDGTWYILGSRDGFSAVRWGISTDKAVAADFDGDGRTDPAVYRSGLWYVLRSRDGFFSVQFGSPDDKPVVGDYDGDAKADVAVWRPSNGVWYRKLSSNGGEEAAAFGLGSDQPTPGDYDGDGRNDLAVYRAGTWYIQTSSSAQQALPFGLAADRPVPAAFVP